MPPCDRPHVTPMTPGKNYFVKIIISMGARGRGRSQLYIFTFNFFSWSATIMSFIC